MEDNTPNIVDGSDVEQPRWYAFKVFFNKVFELDEQMREDGVVTYFPVVDVKKTVDGVVKTEKRPAISSLIFVRCTCEEILAWQRKLSGKVMLYTHVTDGMRLPSPIDEDEMRIFMLVTSADDDRLEYLNVGSIDYKRGQHVRVLEGPYKGCVGYIKRVKGNRRLLVSVEGLALVATSYIPSAFLEKI
ncbi:MAG: UpxY family transcription antiterminator [Bacteroidales bacterium]|nr:UpxY family transcription antiterminator [Bacteroidales bacterium]